MSEQMIKALDDLLSYAWFKTCTHEETHRGGVLWEICSSCGRKWADDEGGKPEWETPESIRKAEVLLAQLKENKPKPTHYAVIDEHGEIVQAFKVKSIISAKEDCVRFIASISKFQDDPDRLKGWTVKGVTVHE